MSASSPEWNFSTKRTVTVILLVAGAILLWFVRETLPIIIVSALLAFVFQPPVNFLTRRVFRAEDDDSSRRGLATLVVFALAIFAIVIAVLIVIPLVIGQLQEFGRDIPQLLGTLEIRLETALSEPVMFNGEPILLEGEPIIPLEQLANVAGINDMGSLFQFNTSDLQAAAEAFLGSASSLTGTAFSFVGGALNTLINTTILLMMTYYLMRDATRIVDIIISLAPKGYEGDAERLFHELGNVWNGYLRGQLLLCLAMGTAVYIAASILGLPNALILGLIAGLLEFVPNIGPLIALIPAAILALISTSSTIPVLEGVPFMIVVIITWTGLQQLEAVFLVPRIMGDSLDLHPVAVIMGVLAGAAIAGALGVILAAPFLATGRVIVRYLYGKLTGRESFLLPASQMSRSPLLARLVSLLWRLLHRIFSPSSKRDNQPTTTG